MATQAITTSPVAVTIPPGTPVNITGPGVCTLGLSSTGAASGPSLPILPSTPVQPAVPASATAIVNYNWFPVGVTVTGGTVSAISVAGTPTGLTSGLVYVQPGQTIAITYTVAPTWVWSAPPANTTYQWVWPGVFINFGIQTLWLVSTSTNTLNYPT